MPLFMTSTRRGALCATVLLATVFLSGNLLPVSIGEGGVKTSSRVSLVADAAKFVHDIGDDFDPEEFDGIEEMMDEEDDEEFEYTPPPTARSPPKKKTKKKKKTPSPPCSLLPQCLLAVLSFFLLLLFFFNNNKNT